MTNNNVYCPNCPRRKINLPTSGVTMDCFERNYHGYGVDMFECPQCNKIFQVSYKIDEITETDWN